MSLTGPAQAIIAGAEIQGAENQMPGAGGDWIVAPQKSVECSLLLFLAEGPSCRTGLWIKSTPMVKETILAEEVSTGRAIVKQQTMITSLSL